MNQQYSSRHQTPVDRRAGSSTRTRRAQWLALAVVGSVLFGLAVAQVGKSSSHERRTSPAAAGFATFEALHARDVASSGAMPSVTRPPVVDRQVQLCQVQLCQVQLCQALGPAAPHCIKGIDCARGDACGELGWEAARAIAWQAFAQGEYVGHFRREHVPEYRLRPDDELEFVYRFTRVETSTPYQLEVGDEITVESLTNPDVNRTTGILPDGTIIMHLLGRVRASRRTIPQLVEELDSLYRKYYNQPAISITPLKTNTRLEDLRDTVDSRFGSGGQARTATVTPEGTIALPAVGSVPVHGLTLEEVKRELNQRYTVAMEIEGIEVTPVLVRRAPRFVYVVGEVRQPGRYTLEGPTTVMQAISLGGGWNVGANLRQVVVFRRGDDWRLMATMLDLRGALYGHQPCPADEIWLNDSDIVVVPKSPILVADEMIDLVFTRGIYGVLPGQSTAVSFAKLGSL